jgi:hypothetical protein
VYRRNISETDIKRRPNPDSLVKEGINAIRREVSVVFEMQSCVRKLAPPGDVSRKTDQFLSTNVGIPCNTLASQKRQAFLI